MPYPIRTCVKCSEEFELKPDKPGFANRCLNCSMEVDEDDAQGTGPRRDADERRSESEMNAERRKAIRDMLYRKDS